MRSFAIAILALPVFAPAASADTAGVRIAAAALDRTQRHVVYDPSYQALAYPMGDVADDRGVCADVIVRALRAIGVDLQELVHDDMAAHFDAYPNRWGLSRPDPNIDHRRVPNLERFFERAGAALPVSDGPDAYQPGDIVSWRLANGLPHIGVVSARRTADGDRPLMVHNIGLGPRAEDVLFSFQIIGHYRWPEDT